MRALRQVSQLQQDDTWRQTDRQVDAQLRPLSAVRRTRRQRCAASMSYLCRRLPIFMTCKLESVTTYIIHKHVPVYYESYDHILCSNKPTQKSSVQDIAGYIVRVLQTVLQRKMYHSQADVISFNLIPNLLAIAVLLYCN